MTTIVLTRPVADSQRLAGLLASEGFKTVCLPLMTIAPLACTEDAQVPELANIWIFVSANAVRFGLPALATLLTGREAPTVIAVGSKTQETLRQYDIESRAPDRQDSEGVLAMPELEAERVGSVLIVKGEGGRDTLVNELSLRGFSVKEFPCYRRCWPDVDLSVLSDKTGEWVFQASSGETLSRLTTVLVEDDKQDLLGFPVVVPSERVANMASQLGWRRVLRADDASDQSVVRVLHHWAARGAPS